MQVKWSQAYRRAALINGAVAAIWTTLLLTRVEPLVYLLPIMADGGPGTWLILGYLLHIVVGFCGFTGFSSLFRQLEEERCRVDDRVVYLGFILLVVGFTSSTILLGVAGALGGYARTIQHQPIQAVRSILEPYVDTITVFTVITVIGVLLNILAAIGATERRLVCKVDEPYPC